MQLNLPNVPRETPKRLVSIETNDWQFCQVCDDDLTPYVAVVKGPANCFSCGNEISLCRSCLELLAGQIAEALALTKRA